MEFHCSCGGGVTCTFGGVSDPPTISWIEARPRPRGPALKRCPWVWSTSPSAFSAEQARSNFGKTQGFFLILFVDTAGHPGPGVFSASGRAGPTPQHLDENSSHISPVSGSPSFICVLRKYLGPACSRTNESHDPFVAKSTRHTTEGKTKAQGEVSR